MFRPGFQCTNEKKKHAVHLLSGIWYLVFGETIGVSILTLHILIDSFYWSDTINLVCSDFGTCASFAHNFVSGMQSFYFSESHDAIVLQTCH